MRNTNRLDSEQAIVRELLNLCRQGIDRNHLEVELARRHPVDLDLLGIVMHKIGDIRSGDNRSRSSGSPVVLLDMGC